MARQAALALDRFDHRGFFAADIGAGAAAQINACISEQARLRDARELIVQHQSHFGIFVADVEVDVARLDHPGRDQHAFDEAVRIALEIITVLEGAGLAFIRIHSEKTRGRLRPHQRPFASGGESRTAKPAQSRIAYRLDHVLAGARTGAARAQERIAAIAHIRVERIRRCVGMRVRAARDRARHALGCCMHHLDMADSADRRAVAGPHAGRANDAHVRTEAVGQLTQEMLAARHGAGKRIADTHGHRRRGRLAFLHHVEVRVEGRDLIDLGQRELHLLRECGKMLGREMPVSVLNEMEMLDQEIAPALALAQERTHLIERTRIDLAPLGRARRPPPPAARLVLDQRHSASPKHWRTPSPLVGAAVAGGGVVR